MHIRQAIVTRYHGPTNTRGSRISATAEAGRIYVAYDYALDATENHAAAARAFAAKWGWSGEWKGGGTNDFNVWVLTRTERGAEIDGFTI